MNKGFTLIEVLVVVLIIGILTSVALPQYQKAVAKARLANIKTYVSTLKEAEEVYFDTYNTYTIDSRLLDISVPCSIFSSDPSVLRCDNFLFIDLIGGNVGPEGNHIDAYYCPNKSWQDCITQHDFTYFSWLNDSKNSSQITCSGRTDFGKSICKNI